MLGSTVGSFNVCVIQFSMTHRKKRANFIFENEAFGQSEGGYGNTK